MAKLLGWLLLLGAFRWIAYLFPWVWLIVVILVGLSLLGVEIDN